MSFRGRGRGRGRGFGGGGFQNGTQASWDPFPEIKDLGTASGCVERLALAKWYSKLHSYWRASPYYYEGVKGRSKGAKGEEIERFSDMVSATIAKPPLSHFIRMEQDYVPAELAAGENKRPTKKVRWNPKSDLDKMDMFEKLEHKFQDADEKKEGEDEEEDDQAIEQEDSEYSDDGDYNQNIDFDDDDDDFNMADDNDDDPTF